MSCLVPIGNEEERFGECFCIERKLRIDASNRAQTHDEGEQPVKRCDPDDAFAQKHEWPFIDADRAHDKARNNEENIHSRRTDNKLIREEMKRCDEDRCYTAKGLNRIKMILHTWPLQANFVFHTELSKLSSHNTEYIKIKLHLADLSLAILDCQQ